MTEGERGQAYYNIAKEYSLFKKDSAEKYLSLYTNWAHETQSESNIIMGEILQGKFTRNRIDQDSGLAILVNAHKRAVQLQEDTVLAYASLELYKSTRVTKPWAYNDSLLKHTLGLFESLNDQVTYAETLIELAFLYVNNGNANEALKYSLEAEEIALSSGDSVNYSDNLRVKSIANFMAGNTSEALDIMNKSLRIAEKIGAVESVFLGHEVKGTMQAMLGDLDSALETFVQGYELGKRCSYVRLYNTQLNIAATYMELGEYKLALNYFKSIEPVEDYSFNRILITNFGQVYFKLDKIDSAEFYLDSAYQMYQVNPSYWQELEIVDYLIKLYKKKEDYKTALEWDEKRQWLNDSINKAANDKELKIITAEHEQEKTLLIKQAEEAEAERTERLRYIIIGVVVLFLMISLGGLYSRFRYIRKSKAIIEKEKDRSETLLHNILPQEVAEELKEKGASDAKDFDEVTVLFSDFKEFTQTAKKLSAKALVSEINACFKAFDAIMQKYQIEKIKTIGDAYMAAGGLHEPRTSEPKDVVLAGLEMQEFMLSRKAEREAKGLPCFDMRVGIHTGPVVAGIVGVKKFQYDIWGDTVNTASRMESHGEIGKVNVSNSTYEILKDNSRFQFESRGKSEVKGLGETKMWFVQEKES
jgi:class 3 adenylate cyclase